MLFLVVTYPCEVPSSSVQLSAADSRSLCMPVTDEEIKAALFSAKPLSSPRPDGFPARFFQQFWPIIKKDVIKAIKSFFETGVLLRQLNHSFISLILKTKHADSFDNFRPISLCNSVYKTITKIVAAHLQGVIPKIIMPNQYAFVKVEKMRNRLQTWAGLYLSKAGRWELIKSVLLSLSHYWTAGFALPSKRGLRVTRIADWNEAAMGTRLWEIATHHPSLWATWMTRRYCKRKSIWEHTASSAGSSLWRKILNSASWIRDKLQYIIFEGRSINALHDLG
ncbi:hypothetical protein QJS10_CPA09g01009 [Acorus calamus]|uniref:Reverse transcriptase domain-containing protein n=1 Tax=Acorus calamus TaxID=4465 RepID=A0AAV9E5J4_ACOCL|nr:hypothetical protein QJS10_CPA09g01009 [Acorus calamus]